MWVNKKEFMALKERVEALEQEAKCCMEDEEEDEHVCCGTPMVETTVFGSNKQFACTKCGMKRDMGIEYR